MISGVKMAVLIIYYELHELFSRSFYLSRTLWTRTEV